MGPRRRLGLLAVTGLVGVLAGCADGSSVTSTANTSQVATTAAGTTDDAPALQRTYVTVDGSTIDLAAYTGASVLFWFWAPY